MRNIRKVRNILKFVLNSMKNGYRGKWTKHYEYKLRGEEKLVQKLLKSFIKMKRVQEGVAIPYLPSHGWKDSLEMEWAKYLEFINNRDSIKIGNFLRNFFRNEGITGLWGPANMYQNFVNSDYYSHILRVNLLMEQYVTWKQNFPGLPIEELDAPRIGNPWGFNFKGNLIYEPVFEYNYQSHYFLQLLSKVEKPVILEIGGGFGGLAYNLLSKNEDITYIGVDLPENVMIQSYYLSCAFPNRKILFYNDYLEALTNETVLDYDICLLPNFVLDDIHLQKIDLMQKIDLIVNVHSLSEMSMDTITEYFKQIDKLKSSYFYHENLCNDRWGDQHGIPSTMFPLLQNYNLSYSNECRWPRYNHSSGYPCNENLFILKEGTM